MAQKVKKGDRVRIFEDTPGGSVVEATVVVVQAEKTHPGKVVGVKLEDSHPRAHTLDGKVEAEGGNGEHRYGWWTRPENLEIVPTK